MTGHAETEAHFAGSNKLFISVWVWLLLLTGFEVFLGYIQLPVTYMLVILMGASIIKAALIVAYFMHLRFERLNLVLTIVPARSSDLPYAAGLFPDSFRRGTFALQRRPLRRLRSTRILG